MAKRDEQGQSEWFGFSCPACHTLFRVPREAMGKQVECPHCGGIVTIPSQDELTPASRAEDRSRTGGREEEGGGKLPARAASAAASPPEPARGGALDHGPEPVQGAPKTCLPPRRKRRKVRKRRVRKKNPEVEPEEFDWEESLARGFRLSRSKVRSFVVAGAAVLILLAGVSGLILRAKERAGRQLVTAEEIPRGDSEEILELADAEVANLEMGALLEDVESVVRRFLEAGEVEELLSLVRGDEAQKERIREYYRRHEHAPVVPRQVAPNGRIMKNGELWAVDVELPDFSIQPIAVERVGRDYKIDWESWVGYSELPWDEFQKTRPAKPALFRVLCSETEYFNFEFSDEKKWKSFRLLSPDGEHLLYGYVPRYSILESMLAPARRGSEEGSAFVLSLRYPENATRENQVLIEEVVESGWVVGGANRHKKRSPSIP